MADGYSAERLTEVTGTPAERLASLARIGLLDRGADGRYAADSVARVALIRHAQARGVTDEDLERFCRESGDMVESLLAAPTVSPALTAEELRSRLPPGALDDDVLDELLSTLGPGPDEPVTEADAAALQMAVAALELGFPADALLQLTRVMADAVQRVAEAEHRVFHDYVHERNRAGGLTGRALLEATDRLSKPMQAMAEPALLHLHRRALAREMRADFVRHLTEHERPPSERPGEVTAALAFVDLAGFTPMTLTMGDTVAAEVLARFGTLVRSSAVRWHGRVVKQIGDAFMLVFDAAADCLGFGVDICAAVAGHSRFPAVHLGAHHGPVLYRDGDYVGTTVNLAARVAGASAAGQFLVTEELAAAAGDPPGIELKPLPATDLKGIDVPQRLLEVRHAHHPLTSDVDPVCGMRLHPDDEHMTALVDEQRYAFCSPQCLERFVASPGSYVTGHR